MPITVNSIGTSYSGCTNHSVRRDRCPHCGKLADLSSYDTRLFFVALFIPLIPLAKKRIINQCSLCRKHYVMAIDDWEKQRLEKLGGAVSEWAADRDNTALASRAVGMAVAFEAREEFMGMTRSFTPALAKDAEFLAGIGDAYGHFGMRAEQAAAYRGSLAVAKSPLVERALGVRLLVSGEVDEGVELIRGAVRAGVPNPAHAAFMAVGALQGQGRHAEALEALEELRTAVPSLGSNKDFLKVQRVSQKNKETGKPVKGAVPRNDQGWVDRPKRPNLSGKGWAWIGASAAVVAALIFVLRGIAHTSSPDVWLVNGMSVTAKYSVDGRVYSVPPLAAVKAAVAQGTHTVHVVDPAGLVPDETVEVHTALLARAFINPTFAINPDRLAHLIERDVVYVARGQGSGVKPNWKMHHGQSLYRFSVDYGFVPHPASLQLNNSGGSETRTLVDVYREETTQELLGHIYATQGADEAKKLTLMGLQRDPTNAGYLRGAVLLEPGELLAVIEPLLARRPVLTELHRVYQDTKKQADARFDLRGQYKAWLDADASNPSLSYLLGRVSGPEERDRRYAAAAAAKPPEPAAVAGWANVLLERGEFARAAEVVRVAREAGVWTETAAEAQRYALVSLGKVEEALQLPELACTTRGLTGRTAEEKVCLLGMLGKTGEANALAQEVRGSEINQPDEMTGFLQSVAEYAAGHRQDAANVLRGGGPQLETRAFLIEDRLAEAGRLIDEMEGPTFDLLLAAGVAAVAEGDKKATAEYSGRLAKMLEPGGPQAKVAADLLRGRGECTRAVLDDLPVDFRARAAVMLLIAAAHPGACAEPLRMAEQMNRLEVFPARQVREGIARLSAKP